MDGPQVGLLRSATFLVQRPPRIRPKAKQVFPKLGLVKTVVHRGGPRVRFSKLWCTGKDSNLRRAMPDRFTVCCD